MVRKTTLAEFQERLASVYGGRYEILEESYSHLTAPVVLVCKEHGEFTGPANYLLLGFRCAECRPKERGPRLSRGKYTHERLTIESAQIYGDSLTVEHFEGEVKYDSLINIRCKKHGTFKRGIKPHLKGKKCSKCAYEDRKLPFQEFLKRANKAHNAFYDYEEDSWSGINGRVNVICPEHGKFSAEAGGHAIGQRRCPDCKPTDSAGERLVRGVLTALKIDFIEQFTAEGLLGQGGIRLRIDFALPSHQTFIEYDGPQHFQPIRFGGKTQEDAERDFDCIRVHDKLKADWAVQNGWRLLRLSSKSFVEEELRAALL